MIKSKGTRTAFVLLVVSMLGFILLLPKGTTDAHAHLSSSIPKIYVAILLLLVIIIIALVFLRKGKKP